MRGNRLRAAAALTPAEGIRSTPPSQQLPWNPGRAQGKYNNNENNPVKRKFICCNILETVHRDEAVKTIYFWCCNGMLQGCIRIRQGSTVSCAGYSRDCFSPWALQSHRLVVLKSKKKKPIKILFAQNCLLSQCMCLFQGPPFLQLCLRVYSALQLFRFFFKLLNPCQSSI